MQNSMVEFILPDLDWKYPFWVKVNLVQKIKIARLNWNSLPRLILLYKIQWYGSFNLFNLFFLGKLGLKN